MTTFVDTAVVTAVGGNGGNGCASVHREKFRPLGGPDGGNGGRGGDVVLVGDPSVSSLLELARHPNLRAGNGQAGRGGNRHGADAVDLVVAVPPGTVVTDPHGDELCDLVEAGMTYVMAAGGRGGLGNAALANQARKAPGFALLGEPGEAVTASLALKLLADVGLVGLPSAGKSSLISAISAARPKIADYPFTTLVPHLGVVQAGELVFTVADVPGLIPGASLGRGLGLEFLRHVERCSVLVHVIDCATLDPGRDPVTDLEAIDAELAQYGDLGPRARVVALNKCDVPEALELAELVKPELVARGYIVHDVSAVSHVGLPALLYELARLVGQARADTETAIDSHRIVVRPMAVDTPGFAVTRTPDGYRVSGARPQRWVRQTDFSNDEAVGYLADRLARLGVEEELIRLGAEPGCTVIIGPDDAAVVFDWRPGAGAADVAGGRSPRGHDERLQSR